MNVSVVIPTKDRLASLQRVLPSFLAQDEVKEVIVVVDGSTDGTLEYLEEYCRDSDVVRFLDNGVNRGVPFSKNRGIDEARCEYVFMAEDDLELSKDFLQVLSSHMASFGADVACGRNIFRFERESAAESIERTNALRGPYVNTRTIEVETSMDVGTDQQEPIIAAPMLARADLFRQIRFDEMYRVNFWREETDFQLSAREHGYTLMCCPHAICFNFVFANDRGGVHATKGLREQIWVIINNWRFLKKHQTFVQENFQIGNIRVHIVSFSANRIVKFVVFPSVIRVLAKVKRRILKSPSTNAG